MNRERLLNIINEEILKELKRISSKRDSNGIAISPDMNLGVETPFEPYADGVE